jgi:2-C-methyl-D-erythritol 2,4-cyclodiphosphate synthase
VIGGVTVPSRVGEVGYSDGDALLHAIIDALFGACGLGDIGSHFPPGDPAYAGISSRRLMREALGLVAREGYRPASLDSVVVLEKPRLHPHIEKIRESIAEDLELAKSLVSVKAKTKESVGAVGKGKAIEAYAVVSMERSNL